MKELLIATGNPGKFGEISSLLSGIKPKLLSLKDLDLSGNGLVEDGDTFEANALKKARFFAEVVEGRMPVIAEDSGLLVEALPGELGVKTRRWGAGEEASDEEWLEFFLKRMEREENRRASFVCSACFYDSRNEVLEFFQGEVKGEITREPRAKILKGLPLSSVFLAYGTNDVYAALGKEEKGKVSHRGLAVGKLKGFLDGKLSLS